MKQQPETAEQLRRKKLLWRANHRGMKELDLVIGSFARDNINSLDDKGLDDLETILGIADPVMLDMVNRKTAVPDELDNEVMRQIMSKRFTTKDYNK